MKLLSLLALLPAIMAIPSPLPAPEAYNAFLPSPLAHSNNPISHGDLNSRRQLSAIHNQAVIAGQSAHVKKRSTKVRKVKRQSGGSASCVPRDNATTTVVASPSATTATATATGTVTGTGATSRTTTQGQATTSPSPSPSPSPSKTSTTPKPAATNFTVDPDGNGPFKGQATCKFILSCPNSKLIIRLRH